jgi:hypothetical protein
MRRLPAPTTKSWFGCCLCLTLVLSSLFNALFLATMAQKPEHPTMSTHPKRAKPVATSFRKLPLSFEANRGQTDRQVQFLSRGPGCSLFLTSTEAVLVLARGRGNARTRPEEIANSRANNNNPKSPVVQMKFVGANPKPEVNGLEQLSGKNNYFIGSDPRQWRTGIPAYPKVRYRNVYRGIDLIYYGDQGQLEYEMLVAPGADPHTIALGFEGVAKIGVDGVGNLVLHIADEKILQRKPNVYQTVNGAWKPIEGKYAIKGSNQIGFEVGAYDRSKPLVIDPVLDYSTFLTGSGADEGVSIAVDSAKNTYITGITSSLNFPTTAGAFQTVQGSNDVFVTKLNAAGTAVLYSTYIGGNGNDEGTSLKVGAAGNAYVTGSTDSPNFPTTMGSFQTSLSGGSDAFIAKLNPTGSALVYSTYLGGSNDDEAFGVATDLSGNAYVTGITESANFSTTTGAYQTVAGGGGDAFVAKMDPTGTALDYSTYIGGNSIDWGFGIATDLAGNAYVTGTTYSPNFPVTAGAYQNSYGGNGDAFVAKLNPAGSALSYSTYLGGSSIDGGFAITYGLAGVVYLTGITDSPNFPASLGALQTVRSGSSDAFITKVNTSLAGPASLVYSTYLGGSSVDWGFGLTTDLAGNAYVTGATHSANFPVSVGTYQGTNAGGSDAFVAKLNPTGAALVYSTYVGGGNNDAALGNAADPAGNAYVTGVTDSSNFPTTSGAFQTNSSDGGDAFVTKLAIPDPGLQINLIDDARTFVTQHYLDFLSREPDSGGFAFWTDQITSCGADTQCTEIRRINVSAAFYLSIEFQQTGYLVERIYKASYGDATGTSVLVGTHQLLVPIVRLNEFLADTQQIGQGVVVLQPGWEQVLENNKQAFTAEFVQRSRFTEAFPTSMTPAQFVDQLNTNARDVNGVKPLSPAERDQLMSDLTTGAKTRAQVLRAVAEDPDLVSAEFNRAFVLMQYLGYLRRNPNDPQDSDYTGYDFWLTKLNQFNGNFVNAEMVKAFIVSGEYRQRFGP